MTDVVAKPETDNEPVTSWNLTKIDNGYTIAHWDAGYAKRTQIYFPTSTDLAKWIEQNV